MRIVLDTNCLIQSIPSHSTYRRIWDSILAGQNVLCLSNEIIEEYSEILTKLTSKETAVIVLNAILNSPYVEFITPYYRFNMIQAYPDDNKFVDCAIAGNAKYIVTNDHHYDILRETPFPHVDVMSITEFLALL
jgi:putative PIN family toxin of toxin-antitoxin system